MNIRSMRGALKTCLLTASASEGEAGAFVNCIRGGVCWRFTSCRSLTLDEVVSGDTIKRASNFLTFGRGSNQVRRGVVAAFSLLLTPLTCSLGTSGPLLPAMASPLTCAHPCIGWQEAGGRITSQRGGRPAYCGTDQIRA